MTDQQKIEALTIAGEHMAIKIDCLLSGRDDGKRDLWAWDLVSTTALDDAKIAAFKWRTVVDVFLSGDVEPRHAPDA